MLFRSIRLRMRYDSHECCRENQNTHFMFSNCFFFEIRAVYEVMWTIMAEADWPHKTIQRMRFSCWVTKSTDIHTHTQTHTQNIKYVLLFQGKNGYANAPQCYVMRSLPLLLYVSPYNVLQDQTE